MISNLYHRFLTDSLFRNSIYLMAATASLSLFGFVFWFETAHLFSDENVGFATTLVSVMNLIALVSLFGCNAALVRFLPKSESPNQLINSALALVTLSSLALAVLFLLFLPLLSPKLLFLRAHPFGVLGFVLFAILTALNTLTDSVFLSHREAKYIFGINSLYSGLRMLFPFFFIPFGALGIFAAAGIAQGIGFLVSIALMAYLYGYRPGFPRKFSSAIVGYSAGNYTASSLNLLPATIIPLMVTNTLSPAQAAYYYMAMMLANLLYVIPFATTRSLFAEGSNDEGETAAHLKAATKIIAALLIPSGLLLAFLAPFILRIFGAPYAANGTTLLVLLSLSGVLVSTASLFNAYFLVRKDSLALILINGVYAVSTVVAAYFLLTFGLTGVGVAWLIGNTLASLTGYLLYRDVFEFSRRSAAIRHEIWVRSTCTMRYLRARRAKGGTPKTILMYPDVPKYYYILYTICHHLGYRMTNNPDARADLAMVFKDVTVRVPDATEQMLKARGRLINGNCTDISKEKVEAVFAQTFGYGMRIDPRTHTGECVQKSNENALHDGKVVLCPREPEAGYIYQKLINNREGDRVSDIRVKIVGTSIPFVMYRTRSAFDRFDNTETAQMVPATDHLSKDEMEKILLFSRNMGIDFGALDCLRDRDDGRLYIVDANLTFGGPPPGTCVTYEEYEVYVDRFSKAFEKEFMTV